MQEYKDLVHYLILFVGIALLGSFFIYYKYEPDIQVWIALLGSAYYVFWGIIHHYIEGRISKFIIFEYILIGCFAFALLFTVLRLN